MLNGTKEGSGNPVPAGRTGWRGWCSQNPEAHTGGRWNVLPENQRDRALCRSYTNETVAYQSKWLVTNPEVINSLKARFPNPR